MTQWAVLQILAHTLPNLLHHKSKCHRENAVVYIEGRTRWSVTVHPVWKCPCNKNLFAFAAVGIIPLLWPAIIPIDGSVSKTRTSVQTHNPYFCIERPKLIVFYIFLRGVNITILRVPDLSLWSLSWLKPELRTLKRDIHRDSLDCILTIQHIRLVGKWGPTIVAEFNNHPLFYLLNSK